MHTQPIIRGGGSWNCAAPLPLFQGNIGFADCILLLTRHKANKSNFGLLRPLTWSEVDHWMPSPPWTTETSNLIRGWPLHALAPCTTETSNPIRGWPLHALAPWTTETSNPIRGWPLHALAPCTTETCNPILAPCTTETSNPIRGWPLHALAPCTTDTSNLIWDWPLHLLAPCTTCSNLHWNQYSCFQNTRIAFTI